MDGRCLGVEGGEESRENRVRDKDRRDSGLIIRRNRGRELVGNKRVHAFGDMS